MSWTAVATELRAKDFLARLKGPAPGPRSQEGPAAGGEGGRRTAGQEDAHVEEAGGGGGVDRRRRGSEGREGDRGPAAENGRKTASHGLTFVPEVLPWPACFAR